LIAVDTNILVYSHRSEALWHEAALACVKSLAEGLGRWAVPWPCVHEFVSITTNERIYSPVSPLNVVFEQIHSWVESDSLVFLHEGPGHLELLAQLALRANLTGPMIHDARIAAICLQHGVAELWTADRDFSRFPALKTRNPLIS
jgi:uncharacterized protein